MGVDMSNFIRIAGSEIEIGFVPLVFTYVYIYLLNSGVSGVFLLSSQTEPNNVA